MSDNENNSNSDGQTSNNQKDLKKRNVKFNIDVTEIEDELDNTENAKLIKTKSSIAHRYSFVKFFFIQNEY